MDVVAVIISGLSLIAAGASWFLSRRSAKASERSADAAEASAQEAAEMVEIERARHRHENTPTFELTGSANMDDLVTFSLNVTGLESSYTVEAEAIEGSYVEYLRTQEEGKASKQRIGLGDVKQGTTGSMTWKGPTGASTVTMTQIFVSDSWSCSEARSSSQLSPNN